MFRLLSLFAWFLSFSVMAEDTNDKNGFKDAVVPNWVKVIGYDTTSLNGKATDGPAYFLIDVQKRLGVDKPEFYRHFAYQARNTDDLEEAAGVKISYDPSYQEIRFHNFHILRKGKKIQSLKASDFEIVRVEEDRDKLIYNGQLSALVNIKDLRLGDVVEYSYTLVGQNPIHKDRISSYIRLGYSVPIGRLYRNINFPTGRAAKFELYNKALSPKKTEQAGITSLEWDMVLPAPYKWETNMPNWYDPKAYAILSDFNSWTDVADWESGLYKHEKQVSTALEEIIEHINTKHQKPENKIKATLDFVQDEIRYLGLEKGIGAYKPRSPSIVLQQRFGDCKDKSLMIVQILGAMGIKAYPVFVDFDDKEHVFDSQPNFYAFDHVITAVSYNGQLYFFDGTSKSQTGVIDTMQQASFGKGLLVDGQQSRIVDIPYVSHGNFIQSITDSYDLISDPVSVSYKVTAEYWGDDADDKRSNITSTGVDKLTEEYKDYYATSYGDVKIITPIQPVVMNETGKLHTEEIYLLGNPWEDSKKNKVFYADPYELTSVLPKTDKASRKHPLSIIYPASIKQILRFKVDENWTLKPEETTINNDVFSYTKKAKMDGEWYEETYTYIAKKDHILPNEVKAVMADYKRLKNDAGIGLFDMRLKNKAIASENGVVANNNELSDEDFEVVIMAILVILCILLVALGIFSFVKAIKVDQEWRADAAFYPVTIRKFLWMNLISVGAYQLFWTYKNWRWLSEVKEQKTGPLFGQFLAFLQIFLCLKKFNNLPMIKIWGNLFFMGLPLLDF